MRNGSIFFLKKKLPSGILIEIGHCNCPRRVDHRKTKDDMRSLLSRKVALDGKGHEALGDEGESRVGFISIPS